MNGVGQQFVDLTFVSKVIDTEMMKARRSDCGDQKLQVAIGLLVGALYSDVERLQSDMFGQLALQAVLVCIFLLPRGVSSSFLKNFQADNCGNLLKCRC